MEPNRIESTNQTPGTVPGSGSGAAPLTGEPSAATADAPTASAAGAAGAAGAPGPTGTSGSGPADASFRGRASEIKSSFADRLEAGADRLRGTGSPAWAGAAGEGSIGATEESGRLAHVKGALADGMKSTAGWLRDVDVEGLKEGIEKQVKEHPARSVLVALGVGYLLGKAFRR